VPVSVEGRCSIAAGTGCEPLVLSPS
jgi:hypothetical protein